MKFAHFLLAGALLSFSAASAQTTPNMTQPSAPNTSNPSAVPSGTPPAPSNPKGAVSPGEAFTTGSPDGQKPGDTRSMKHKKDKGSMSDGKGKMKTKM